MINHFPLLLHLFLSVEKLIRELFNNLACFIYSSEPYRVMYTYAHEELHRHESDIGVDASNYALAMGAYREIY